MKMTPCTIKASELRLGNIVQRPESLRMETPESQSTPSGCPTCGEHHYDQNDRGRYDIGGTKYPRIGNGQYIYMPEPVYEWDEIHYCIKCKKEYRFKNADS